MLKRKVTPLVFVIFVFLCTFKVPSAATNCEQSFTFFAFTRAASPSLEYGTFWIGEDVGGECLGSYLIQISISNQRVSSYVSMLMGYAEWGWLREGIKHLQRVPFEELVEKGRVWQCATGSFSVEAPLPDSVLSSLLLEAFRKGNERAWTRDHGLEGTSPPVFDGIKAQLIHYHEKGLYVGYQISKAYYFPGSKYLLIFTHQPMLVSGLDTMHGFLIFKVTK